LKRLASLKFRSGAIQAPGGKIHAERLRRSVSVRDICFDNLQYKFDEEHDWKECLHIWLPSIYHHMQITQGFTADNSDGQVTPNVYRTFLSNISSPQVNLVYRLSHLNLVTIAPVSMNEANHYLLSLDVLLTAIKLRFVH
jgi:hypothetical protein